MFQVQIAMHHDFICLQDDHFEKAQEFRPERWLRSNKARDETHPFASVPFGFGPRACIGRRFAEQESHIALIKVLHTDYRLGPANFIVSWLNKKKPTVDCQMLFDVCYVTCNNLLSFNCSFWQSTGWNTPARSWRRSALLPTPPPTRWPSGSTSGEPRTWMTTDALSITAPPATPDEPVPWDWYAGMINKERPRR